MAFRGTFDHTLDAKNRLTIPAKFRASLAEGVVLSKGIERCVQVWTPKAYDAYVRTRWLRRPGRRRPWARRRRGRYEGAS